ncbi:hypothetical protein [Nocardioides sp. L-11A]|uniref:hypothetical protein n=1 Tax=Nocardioides sp. L-11A TaxID=3043848 RepID=UPI00249B810A|nr:hypothetical protein QJ852_08785 [Nocardioides sp. L-11A]
MSRNHETSVTPSNAPDTSPISHRFVATEHAWTGRLIEVGLVLAIAAWTVLRYGGTGLNADGVEQSTMSVQSPSLFYWGQNRLASFVSLLASPVSSPDANLFVCMFLNALGFVLLLRLLSGLLADHLGEKVRALPRAVPFLVLAAAAFAGLEPITVHALALEGQPYSWSWFLAWSAFLLWRRSPVSGRLAAVAFAGIAMGLNPSVALVPAFLTAVEVLRTRRLIPWIGFGAVWIAWLGVWLVLMDSVDVSTPTPQPDTSYFSFDPHLLATGFSTAVGNVLGAFGGLRLVVLIAFALAVLLWRAADVPASTIRRFAVCVLFCLGYTALFAGNPWTTANTLHFRYFFPDLLLIVGVIASTALLAMGHVASTDRRQRQAAVIAVALAACLAALAGPARPAWDGALAREAAPIADFARSQDARFIAGDYWLGWPTMHQMLEDGRTAAYVANEKSGGDLSRYETALVDEIEDGGTPPRAVCIRADTQLCATYLDFYTGAGWQDAGPCEGLRSRVPCTLMEYHPTDVKQGTSK